MNDFDRDTTQKRLEDAQQLALLGQWDEAWLAAGAIVDNNTREYAVSWLAIAENEAEARRAA